MWESGQGVSRGQGVRVEERKGVTTDLELVGGWGGGSGYKSSGRSGMVSHKVTENKRGRRQ